MTNVLDTVNFDDESNIYHQTRTSEHNCSPSTVCLSSMFIHVERCECKAGVLHTSKLCSYTVREKITPPPPPPSPEPSA